MKYICTKCGSEEFKHDGGVHICKKCGALYLTKRDPPIFPI